jgi:iron complex transport system substrate-binding protein
MKKEWYTILFIWLGLILFVGVFVPLLRHLREPSQNLGDISNKPYRIVSLSPNLTEILFALGLEEQIVGVSNDSDYPPEAKNKKKIGTFWQPSTEAIIACKPDLVVTLWFEQQKAVADSLKRLGYRILTLKIEKIGELLKAIQKIGTMTDRQPQAEQLLEKLNGQLNDLQLKLGSANKVRVLWVVQVEPLRIAGRDTFINELIKLAGGENAIGDTLQQYPPIGTEEILTCGAEVIIQSAMGTGDMTEQQKAAERFWSRWENVLAVKNNRIYVVEPDTVTRLGPRLYEGVELIARCLHPTIFEQVKNTAH